MTSVRHSRLLQFTGLLLSALVWLANNANPPTGKTAAPFDGTCAETACHGIQNVNGFDGDISLSGLPGTIMPNTVYPLSITMTPTAGSPIKGGFQIVMVDGSNVNAGNLAATNAQTGTEFFATREYLEQRNGKIFTGGSVTWDFNWTSPANGVAGNTIKAYYIGNFANNNNNSSGDFIKAAFDTYAFEGPPPVTATITSSANVLCAGGNTGTATVEAAGGVPPYSYLWSNGQTTATAINLVANTYSVTVTGSSNSGTATASVVITQPPALSITASVAGVLTCTQTTVTATAAVSGGTPGYDIDWSNNQTGNPATFDAAGSYTVTVTDANGCTKVTAFSVSENIVLPTATVATAGVITCTNAQITLNGAGSSQGGNFSYLWTTGPGGNIVSGATTLTPIVNGCGSYTLTVTNTLTGCTSSDSEVVSCQVSPPNISVSNSGPLTCTTLSATLNGNSSTAGVTYAWTGPNGFNSPLQNPTTTTPGTYTLVVTNPANSCTSSATTVVAQNILAPTDTTNVSGVITCTLDSVQIFMSTNIQNGTYLWTGPNGFTSTQKRDTIAVPGAYIGIVTNPVNGCKGRDTIVVVQNIAPPGATAAVSGNITCSNSSVQLTGGPSGQNTYAWTGPNNFSSTQQNPTTNSSGNYTLVVTAGSNGCTSSASVEVQPNLNNPTANIAPPGNLNCNNTTIQLDATSSSQGALFTNSWTTSDGIIVSGGTSLTPTIGAAGTYTLVVTNGENGCSASVSTAVIQLPAVIASLSSSTNVACNGGSTGAATVTPSGGNGVYTYLWSTGATTATISQVSAGSYVVIVFDGEGCTSSASVSITQPALLLAGATTTGETSLGANNGTATALPTGGTPNYTYAWSNSGTSATITGLTPGSYTVSVGDANGCTVVQTVTVNAFGCSLAGSISSTNATCNGANNGTASVTLTGAADPVSFVWSNGVTTQNITGLEPGAYTVSVLDGNNCPAVLNTTVNEPPVVSANAVVTNETANGANDGTATAIPTGGTGTYSYSWSNSATTATISGLAPGVYTVSVTDTNNCSAVQTVNVSAFNCLINASITGANVSCFGGNDGLATAALSGGQLPYIYVWSTGATTATIGNLAAGTYTAITTDAAGCIVSEMITITQPQALSAQAFNIQNVVCPADISGSASIIAQGGTAPYTISGNLTNLGVGVNTVLVTDANGCTTNVSFNITATDNVPPTVSCPSTIFACGADFISYPAPTATDNCGSIGAPTLISGLSSGSVFNDGTTIQVYRATDAASNTATCSFAVVVYPIPDILFDGSTDDQNGQGVGTISVSPIGGGGGFFYVWNKNGQFFSNSEDLSGLNAGSYTLTITDMNGCTSALSPVVVNNTVGTLDIGQSGSIRLYPNPAATSFQLEIIDLEVIAARIFDTRGRIIYELAPSEWQNDVLIDKLSTGVYFLRLSTENGRVLTLKFVKSE
jgi:hypothetical protein